MDLVEWLEAGLAVFVILFGQVVLWVKFKTLVEMEVEHLKGRADGHDKCISFLKTKVGDSITMLQHDKLQEDCRKSIYSDISHLTSSMDEMRGQIKATDEKLDVISLSIVELRSDLRHMGAVK